jgi:hypothetical protein
MAWAAWGSEVAILSSSIRSASIATRDGPFGAMFLRSPVGASARLVLAPITIGASAAALQVQLFWEKQPVGMRAE